MSDDYDFIDHDDTTLAPDVVETIQKWLQPTDYLAESGEFRRHVLSQAPGTGLWICQTDEYRKWHDSSDHGSLWIKGVPGAGKSVTAASIVQHLQVTEPDCPVLFFFFRHIVAANSSPRALIQDWLAQLVPHSPKLQFALHSRLDTSVVEISPNDLFQLFLDGASSVRKVYCVGDALDEMATNNRPFLDNLNILATHSPSSLKMLITSRPKQYLQSALRDASIVHVSLQQKLVDMDIMAYLNHRFDMATSLNAGVRSLRQQVVEVVAKRSKGLFLYAKLTMDQVEASLLSEGLSDISLLERALPVGLEEMYTSMLANQRQEHGVGIDLQVLILGAVTCASRPLRLNELAALVKFVCPDAPAPRGAKSLVSACCGPLVEVLEDETLQIIHHSLTEFIRGDGRSLNDFSFPIIDTQKVHKEMTINCLGYVQSGPLLRPEEQSGNIPLDISITYETPEERLHIFRAPKKADPFDYREARLLHPLLQYAVENWSHHASLYDGDDDEFLTTITNFVDPESLNFRRWLVLEWGTTSKTKESNDGIPTPLHIAAYAGLSGLALRLLENGASVSSLDAQDRIPLHWAAANGHTNVSSLLIQYGSGLNMDDTKGIKPIHLAARKGHAAVARLLMEAGVAPNTMKTKNDYREKLYTYGLARTLTKGECPILYASRNGHTETLITMIPFCRDAETLAQLLCECCRFGRTEAALAVLEHSGVLPDAMYRGATALFFACGNADVKCVKALIRRGADVRKLSEWKPLRRLHVRPPPELDDEVSSMAPLHRLLLAWRPNNNSSCRTILKALIEAGADMEQLDGLGNSPLLLAAGADIVDSGEVIGRTLAPHIPALRALLEAGADIQKTTRSSHPGCNGDGALHLLLRNPRSQLDVIRFVVDHGSDVNQLGDRDDYPLQCLLDRSRHGGIRYAERKMVDAHTIVEFLLQNGADPTVRRRPASGGGSVLHEVMYRWVSVFRTMLTKCSDDSIKEECWSAFSPNSRNVQNLTTYLEIFREAGIGINTAHPVDGNTLYLRSVRGESFETLRILKEHGAKSDAVDSAGNSAMHLLASVGPRFSISMHPCSKLERLRKLVKEEDLDPRRTNYNGDTLLHMAATVYEPTEPETDLVRWLVSLGIPFDSENREGHTAQQILMNRTRDIGCLSEFAKAISGGTKDGDTSWIEIQNKDGLNPLHMAVMRSESEVWSLLAAGANLASPTGDGQNVLHLACRARKPNIVGHIINEATSLSLLPGLVNQADGLGKTALHYASASGEPESVAFLLENGADATILDLNTCSVLHACVEFRAEQTIWDVNRREGHHDAFRPLTEERESEDSPWDPSKVCGSAWYIRSDGGQIPQPCKTFFHSVCIIAKMLLDADCDPSVVNEQGFTALDHALHVNCPELVEVIETDDGDVFSQSTKHMQDFQDNMGTKVDAGMVERYQQSVKTQMLLMRPRSSTPILSQDKVAVDWILESPRTYMSLLTREDIVHITDQGFTDSDKSDARFYNLLRDLLGGPEYLQVVEQSHKLVLYYSSPGALEKIVEIREHEYGPRWPDGKNTHLLMGWTPLQMACQHSQPNMLMVKLLVEKHHVDVDTRCATPSALKSASGLGGTALHIVASANSWWHLDALRYLLAHGADINARDETGQTPLHMAARGFWCATVNDVDRGYWGPPIYRLARNSTPRFGLWRLEAVRILLKQGADPNILDNENHSPLQSIWKCPNIARELLQAGAKWTLGTRNPIFDAIHEQNLGSIEALLDHGVDVNTVDESSGRRNFCFRRDIPRKFYTLLCASQAEKDNTHSPESAPLARCLVERGADLYLPLNDEETLIHFIFGNAEAPIIDMLLKEPCVSKIDFNARDQGGRTVLMAACRWTGQAWRGYSSSLEWDQNAPWRILNTLRHAADPTLYDHDGKYPIHHILENPHYSDQAILDFINHPGVAPTIFTPDKAGYTPLHTALRYLRPVVVEALVAKGAGLLDPDANGCVALHHIARQCFLTDRQNLDRYHHSTHTSRERRHPKDYFEQCMTLWNRYIELAGGKHCINIQDNKGNTPLMVYLGSTDKNPRRWSEDESENGLEEDTNYDLEDEALPDLTPIEWEKPKFGRKRKRVCHLEYLDRVFPSDSGVDLLCRNHKGETALHVIAARLPQATFYSNAWEGHDKVVFEALMARGLDPLREDERGRSALDVADACGKGDIVDLFRRKG